MNEGSNTETRKEHRTHTCLCKNRDFLTELCCHNIFVLLFESWLHISNPDFIFQFFLLAIAYSNISVFGWLLYWSIWLKFLVTEMCSITVDRLLIRHMAININEEESIYVISQLIYSWKWVTAAPGVFNSCSIYLWKDRDTLIEQS